MSSTPNFDRFPAELKALRRWVTWRYEIRKSKRTKRPLQSVGDSCAWLSLSEACEVVDDGKADGVGFILGAGVVGIDLDSCIAADGTLHEIALDAIALGTYTETSAGGHGLHCFIRATISRSRKIGERGGVPGHEIYDGRKGSARFFAVTGVRVGDESDVSEGPHAQAALDAFVEKWFPEAQQTVALGSQESNAETLDDDRVLQLMFNAKDGPKWRKLFQSDYSSYPSQSEADLALCGKLRFYTQANPDQIDRLFRKSGLMRRKWGERHGAQTYGQLTIAKAIAKGGPLYTPRDAAHAASARDLWVRKAWAGIPAWVWVTLGGAGELACRVYGIIASHADADTGEAWPTVETIAAILRVSERRVKTALQVLKASRVLTWTRRPLDSNLYRLALTVPETITPYALRGGSLRVTESGHLGCPSHDTVTNQELTINKHRRERDTELENQSSLAERKDAERPIEVSALPAKLSSSTASGTSEARSDSRYDGWDGTSNTAKGRDLLWKYAEEKLGLAGRVILGSDAFDRPHDPTQSELGL